MKKLHLILGILAICVGVFYLNSCKKLSIREATTDDVNMLDYLSQDSLGRFSKLVQIIQRTGYDAYLNAYGTYTLFAPTDEAIDAYLSEKGVSSVDQVDVDELKDMLRFHLLEQVINTADFNDGKLPFVTMYGQYLVTGVQNTDGVSSYIVNRQATVEDPNVTVGNGVVQVIDHVLTPSIYSLAQLVEQDPDYSIFTQALKETGYYDTLNSMTNDDGSQRWLTVLAETDQALADTGIYSYADLKEQFSNTGDPTNPNDSLHLFVAYHILKDIKYLADIVIASSHETLAPLEVVTSKVVDDKVLINDDEYSTIDGIVHEPGVELLQSQSDVSATNGVLHHVVGHLAIKVRKPFPVYWDLCATVPELTRLANVYRSQTYLFDYNDGNAFADIKWEKSCLKYRAGVNGYLGDYWQVGMGRSSSNTNSLGTCSGNAWIEFTTPLLVKGKYKVWFCYYTQNTGQTISVQASFDSIPLTSALINFNKKISTVDFAKEAEQEALGWKWWAGVNKKSGSTVGRMLGIVDVQVTGRHKIRFDLVDGANADCNFDMVHFIPVGMNQTSPRFNPDGTIEY